MKLHQPVVNIFFLVWQIAGIYPENCRVLKTESCNDYSLSPETLEQAISTDVASGLIPLLLCATVRNKCMITREGIRFQCPS